MTAKTALIYAKGGGEGHANRSGLIAQWLNSSGHDVTLVLRYDQLTNELSQRLSGIQLQSEMPLNPKEFDHILVDTFPFGHEGEIRPEELSQGPSLTLISRASSDPHWLQNIKYYSQLISPYPKEFTEWNRADLDKEKFCGWIVTPVQFEFLPRTLLILDPGKRLPADIYLKMKPIAQHRGMVVNYLTHWEKDHIFQGAKVFIIGAGYNTFYEWMGTNADIRFLPLQRRWDDQPARARRFGLSVETLMDWVSWIESPVKEINSFKVSHYSDPKKIMECLCPI